MKAEVEVEVLVGDVPLGSFRQQFADSYGSAGDAAHQTAGAAGAAHEAAEVAHRAALSAHQTAEVAHEAAEVAHEAAHTILKYKQNNENKS